MRGWIALLLVACSGKAEDPPTPPAPQPGPLQVGVASVRMPVPLGIGTAGYGGFGIASDPTPFSELYPGTQHIHQHPDFRAIAISRGPGFELIFLRIDTVGTFQQLRRAVVLELQERTGRDLDDALIIGATHTHSGPGRVIDQGGVFELIADKFLPEFYAGIVDAMADAVELALADLEPGRVGLASGYSGDGHNDRRCEDGLDYENGTLPLIAVEQAGETVGVMMAYAVHGTVLGIDDLTLSQDVSGGIEFAVEDRFDHLVQVQMFNSWGADMSPGSPAIPTQAASPTPGGYDQIQTVGAAVADAVETALLDVVWLDEPDLLSRTFRVPIDRTVIGYEAGVFPYDYGGVYCSGPEADCEDPAYEPTPVDGLDQACIPFTAEYPAPNQTEMTAGHIEDLQFVTFPGEPGTLLAEQVMDAIRAQSGSDVMFLGYTQDYIGYSILEEDWWLGGYEASGALWGPRQGELLAQEAVLTWERAHGTTPASPAAPDRIPPFDDPVFTPYAAPIATGFGDVLVDVAPSAGALETVLFTVAGHDPWFGAPVATLLDGSGNPVLRPSGRPLNSDGLGFWVDLATDPTYGEDLTAADRQFQWTFNLPLTHPVPGLVPALSGTYRLAVELPDGAGGIVTVTSADFVVTP